ncbi:MAG: hypothetical protein WD648_06015 [Planctomycetaceae bacterium]
MPLFSAEAATTQTQDKGPPGVAKSAEAGPVLDIPAKVARYLERRFRQLDKNQNGRLEREEWQTPQPSSNPADANGDGILTRDELKDRVLSYGRLRRVRVLSSTDEGSGNPSTPAAADSADGDVRDPAPINGKGENSERPKESNGADVSKTPPRRDTQFFVPAPRLPQGIPDWWRARDANGDGQLTLREFAPQASAADIAGFKKLDVNSDGLVTPSEYVRATSAKKTDTAKSPGTPTR